MAKVGPLNEGQQEAVVKRGCSILVSAPAGSGKTKILVSRILSLLEKDRYHVDGLLVLTFTNAAALEMKQRLEQDLDARLKEITDPTIKEHLLLQKQKLPTAYITNFHGFCSTLLKQYGYLLGIPSTFEILSDPTLIQHEVLDACIENWLQKDTFKTFLMTNFSEYHFSSFKTLLFKLHTLSHTFEDFETYKQALRHNIYQPIIDAQPLDTWPLTKYIKEALKIKAIEGKNKVYELRNYCQRNGLTFFYHNPYEKGKNKELPSPMDCYLMFFTSILENLETKTLEEIIRAGIPSLEKAYRASFDDDTKPFQKEYTRIKGALTRGYTTLFEDLLYTDSNEFSTIMKHSLDTLEMLFLFVKEFEHAYSAYKKEKHWLDFNDLESYAHQLLEPQYQVVDTLYHQLQEIMIDEYQDTNQVQETLIMKIAEYQKPTIPCFMVGDMKQSIYKFRGGDPAIFNQKYNTFSTSDIPTNTKRIDLRFNYRSNKIVLDSVNYICNQIMDVDIGGLDYYLDESAKLNYDFLRKEGAKTTAEEEQVIASTNARLDIEERFTSEVLIVENNKEGTLTTAEKEAMVVAKRIQQLVNDCVLDDWRVKKRKAEYKDIVVLMRNTTEFITFKKVFDRYQIPNQIVLSQGFLQAQEVINSIYVLKAIDNHLDDIAMTSILKGNYTMSHFDEQLLINIRKDTSISMYENLLLYVENKQDQYVRVLDFIHYYESLVLYSKQHTVKETLVKFYEDSQYLLFISSLINGKQRYANVELFIEQIGQSEDDLHTQVTNFSTKIEHGVNMAPGQVISTNSNTVSFMTIHKSKGLEFPIVFVSQMHKKFNKQESRERLLIDKTLGIALNPRIHKDIPPYQNITVEYTNKYRKLIANVQAKELMDEELRIFYVALTRASQKLILTGAVDSFNTLIQWQHNIIDNEEDDIIHRTNDTVLFYRNIRNVNSYMDWLGVSIMRHPNIISQCKQKQVGQYLDDDLLEEIKRNADTVAIYENPNVYFLNTMHAKFHMTLITDEVIAQYSYPRETQTRSLSLDTYYDYQTFQYPNENVLEKTIAVTKKIHDGDREAIKVEYDMEDNAKVQGSDRGTIIHSVLEHIPLQVSISIEEAMISVFKKGIYDTTQKQVINEYMVHLEDFIYSDIYQLLVTSEHVYREKQFSLKDDCGQIIHGVFDAIVVNEQTITIIDYKTDRVSKNTTTAILQDLHRPQMEYYKKLLQKVFPTYSIQAIVYYLYINTYVQV